MFAPFYVVLHAPQQHRNMDGHIPATDIAEIGLFF
jgi:hypothetical protein